jgi:exodeoxyribonuclease-1
VFIFYDTETSGLGEDFTQILQIALVFTDDNLNILSSKKVECRRAPWVIPSPGALLTTGFTPEHLKKSKNSQYQMMTEVDQWVRSQYMPVIFAGYNTLGYDEAVLAQNLHQTLLPTGLTQEIAPSGQSNGRFDVLTLVRAAAIYMPGLLTLDETTEFGGPAISLGAVARQNGVALSEDEAHDAMNDIKATIGVARLIQKSAPALWDQMAQLSTPAGVDAFMDATPVFTLGALSGGKSRAVVATSVATREGDGNCGVLFDLSVDPAKYMAMTVEELAECLSPKRSKSSPFRQIRKNGQPILMPVDQSDAVLPAEYDEALCDARARMLKSDAGFAARLARASAMAQADIQAKKTVKGADLPERQMDLPVPQELAARVNDWVREFKTAPDWQEAKNLTDDFYVRFEEDLKTSPHIRRFVQFARRIVFEDAPETFAPDQYEQMKSYIAERLLNPDPEVPYMTVAKARKELESIETSRAEGKPRWQAVSEGQIRSLKLYYTAIEREYAPYAPTPTAPAAEEGDATAQKKPENGIRPDGPK